jgi:hypothetical protein
LRKKKERFAIHVIENNLNYLTKTTKDKFEKYIKLFEQAAQKRADFRARVGWRNFTLDQKLESLKITDKFFKSALKAEGSFLESLKNSIVKKIK